MGDFIKIFVLTIRNLKILYCKMVVTREKNADLNAALCVTVGATPQSITILVEAGDQVPGAIQCGCDS